MALLVRPLILSPVSKWPLRRCINSISDSKLSNFSTGIFKYRPFFTGTSPSILIHRKNLHLSRSRGLRPADAPLPSEVSQRDSESDSSDAAWKSRNEKKREARRGVRWAMQLADFNDSQIKRILRIASLEEEVFDALMLVKRLGRDVREGKRRQFSYIATRWFDGLVNKDVDIANEIYSLSTVEFDRQELRKLVRNFCSMQDRNATTSEEKVGTETDVGLSRAKRHLTRFLVALAKQLPTEENYTL
ncbi:Ribosome-associated, YjgA [Cynara cardunculus var. scolymus]|uniref:Ribosome-associated, YjgA n=1 Tax=Cynara cardunculus var. scolymus TaxID=59895 RepID=A0A103YDY4_CYNCS|nr:Ribosome-associated, YjgA [Cynara cardunculus var. scolymus]